MGKTPALVPHDNYYLAAGVGALTVGLLVALPIALAFMGPPKKSKPESQGVESFTRAEHPRAIAEVAQENIKPAVQEKSTVVESPKQSNITNLIPQDQPSPVAPEVVPVTLPVEFASLQTKKTVDDGLPKIDEDADYGPGNPEKRQFTVQDLNTAGLTIPDAYLKKIIQPVHPPGYTPNQFTFPGSNVGQPGFVVNYPGTIEPSSVRPNPMTHLPKRVVVTPNGQYVLSQLKIKVPVGYYKSPSLGGPAWKNTWKVKWKEVPTNIFVPQRVNILNMALPTCSPSRPSVFWHKR